MGVVKFLYYKTLLFLIYIQLVERLKKKLYNLMGQREYEIFIYDLSNVCPRAHNKHQFS